MPMMQPMGGVAQQQDSVDSDAEERKQHKKFRAQETRAHFHHTTQLTLTTALQHDMQYNCVQNVHHMQQRLV